jgi:hypothetical protein
MRQGQDIGFWKGNDMSELHSRDRFSTWWQGQSESQRDFTKLELVLLGALLASIGLNFIVTMLYFLH